MYVDTYKLKKLERQFSLILELSSGQMIGLLLRKLVTIEISAEKMTVK